ncbi:MAG: hypothetical protein DI536_07995 [Archangium gephyra]|uniref:Uncharacterized protein n=1 Tax=Archangium gephyra TaxID=48 RepID=A0A2W5TVH4_9BACT|nr:MAG: hypothetical protein DI536_07995 [Archangium gephyra]
MWSRPSTQVHMARAPDLQGQSALTVGGAADRDTCMSETGSSPSTMRPVMQAGLAAMREGALSSGFATMGARAASSTLSCGLRGTGASASR